MAKEYAKKFYKSKAWQNCRNAFFDSKLGICELCGKPGKEVHHKKHITPQNIHDPKITLSWDNLQLLCSSCHCAIHEKSYEMHRARGIRNTSTANGLRFDDDGNLIEDKNVFIVWGSPASGKTHYVKEHRGKYDLIIDLDFIIGAVSMSDGKKVTGDYLPFALEVRDLLYNLIEERKHYFEKAWIVSTLPKKEDRLKLQNKLKAELIHIDTSKEECLKHARLDDKRQNKELQYKIIEKYFTELEI